MTDQSRAIGAAIAVGFDGYLPRLERRRTVCDLPAIESIEFCEDESRALVSLVVPFSEVPALLHERDDEIQRLRKALDAAWLFAGSLRYAATDPLDMTRVEEYARETFSVLDVIKRGGDDA